MERRWSAAIADLVVRKQLQLDADRLLFLAKVEEAVQFVS